MFLFLRWKMAALNSLSLNKQTNHWVVIYNLGNFDYLRQKKKKKNKKHKKQKEIKKKKIFRCQIYLYIIIDPNN